MDGLVKVVMLRRYGSNGAGTIAGFTAEVAERLCSAEPPIAVPFLDEDDEALEAVGLGRGAVRTVPDDPGRDIGELGTDPPPNTEGEGKSQGRRR